MRSKVSSFKSARVAWRFGLGVWLFSGACSLTLAATLELAIVPKFAGETIQPDSLRYATLATETFSITRVSYLMSGLALQCADGAWLELTNEVAWFDLEKLRSSHRVTSVPPGEYRSLRFHIGPAAKDNHADVARFPADHPLNPNLNNLHWSWQGGYIFLALEGRWRNANGALDGWSFHLARSPNRTPVTLAFALNLTNDARLELDFDLATLLNAPRPLSFGKDGSSTHSREGDLIAAALVANLPGAFTVRRVISDSASRLTVKTVIPLYLPDKFTPYRFQMRAGFPIPDLPKDNPLIEERVALGEKLFHEEAMSENGTLSCASCHDEKHAFADPRRYSIGVRGQSGTRNAMPLLNLAWKSLFFWDGRAPSLRAQALMPIQDHVEMDETLTNVALKLAARTYNSVRAPGESDADKHYPGLFAAAFGSPEVTPEKIGLALESYMLTLTSFDSRFDRSLRGEAKLTDEEQHGLQLFMTEYDPRREQYGADCFHCHGGPLFQSQTFANNGLDGKPLDSGRAKVSGKESDQGRFATPSLRNVALTAPYMHDGRFKSLEEVVEHYNSGVKRSATLDPNLAKHPDGGINLSAQDQRALVAFLKTLTDVRFETSTTQSGNAVKEPPVSVR